MGKPLRFPKIELCKLQDLPLPKLVFLNAITHPLTIVIACYTYQKPNHHEPTITSINQYQALKSKLVYQHLPTIQTIPILTIVPPHKKTTTFLEPQKNRSPSRPRASRARICWPPPQATGQVLQGLHPEMSHLTKNARRRVKKRGEKTRGIRIRIIFLPFAVRQRVVSCCSMQACTFTG